MDVKIYNKKDRYKSSPNEKKNWQGYVKDDQKSENSAHTYIGK